MCDKCMLLPIVFYTINISLLMSALVTIGQKSLDSEPARSAAGVTIVLNTLSAVADFSMRRKSVTPRRERICC